MIEMGAVDQFQADIEDAAAMDEMIALRQSMAQERDAAQAVMDECNKRIGERLALMGGAYKNQLWAATLVVAERSTLDKKKLVELGVPVATIEAATVKATSSSVRVVKR